LSHMRQTFGFAATVLSEVCIRLHPEQRRLDDRLLTHRGAGSIVLGPLLSA
jgi:hypothetical protein